MRPSRRRRFSATMKTLTRISRHLRAQNRLYRPHERVSTLFVETVVSIVTAEMKDFLLAWRQVALHDQPGVVFGRHYGKDPSSESEFSSGNSDLCPFHWLLVSSKPG